MPTPLWEPGTLYVPGALVRPRTEPPVQSSAPGNANFEAGDTGWATDDAGIFINSLPSYDGAWCMDWTPGVYGTHTFTNDTEVTVTAGTTINVRCYHRRGTDNAGRQGSKVGIQWLDSSHNPLSQSYGALRESGKNGPWHLLEGGGTAPTGAAYAQIIVEGYNDNDGGSHGMRWDAFSWDYVFADPPDGLLFRAVQTDAGYSADQEPTWPSVLGQTVVDNEVTWEAVLTSRVVWEASPVLVSGGAEPTWPTDVGAEVADNTISWQATSGRIEDEKCPNSKYVIAAASKIFAADEDIISYCATINPLDWQTPDDAGYLPFGLQTFGSNPIRGMGLYRGNLTAFNSEGFQMWQVDQDPAAMALLDAVPVGCEFHASIQPLANDEVLLTSVGVRNLTIAGASTNLQADGVGEPIDALVTPKIRANLYTPIGAFIPNLGQYWLIFGPDVYVLTINGAKRRSWTRYVFPEAITDWTLDEGDLYLRTASHAVLRVDPQALRDNQEVNSASYSFNAGGTHDTSTEWSLGFDLSEEVGSLSDDYAQFRVNGGSAELNLREIRHVREPGDNYLVLVMHGAAGIPGALNTFVTLAVQTNSGIRLFDAADATTANLGGNEREWTWTVADTTPMFTEDETYTIAYIQDGDEIESSMQWPHLDQGAPGADKTLVGFDVTADAPAGVKVSVGYDQRNPKLRTEPYLVAGDTAPGMPIPLPVTAPSFSLRIDFEPDQLWEWQAANLYTTK